MKSTRTMIEMERNERKENGRRRKKALERTMSVRRGIVNEQAMAIDDDRNVENCS